MASIIDYFNSLPTSVGSSTFQLDNLMSNKLLDPTMSSYQTLIGSVDENFKNAFETGTNNKFPALLMHAADIFWGDATLTNSRALEKLSEINLYKANRIRTTRDIIAILEYLLAHVGTVTEYADLIVNPTSLELSESKTSGTFTASLSRGTIEGTKVNWTLVKKSGADNIQINGNTGSTVVISRKNAPITPAANKGTTTLGNWQTNDELGTATLTATFKPGNDAVNDLSCVYDIVTSYPETTSDITSTITYTGLVKTPGLPEGSWYWVPDGDDSFPAGIQVSGQNTKTITLTNTTNNPIYVALSCKNDNATEAVSTFAWVPGVKSTKKYYYLASVYGLDASKNYVGATDIFGEFDIIGNGDKVIKMDVLQNSLSTVRGIIGNDSDNAEDIWVSGSTFNEHGAKKFYPFIIAPKTWYNNNSTKIIKPVAGGDAVKETREFTYNGDSYMLIITEKSFGNNTPENPLMKIIS